MASMKQRYVIINFFFTKLCHFGLAKVQYRRYRKGVYLKYGVIPTSASRSVSCLYLTCLEWFDYKVARRGNFQWSLICTYPQQSEIIFFLSIFDDVLVVMCDVISRTFEFGSARPQKDLNSAAVNAANLYTQEAN